MKRAHDDSTWKRRLRIQTEQPEAVTAILRSRTGTTVHNIAGLRGRHSLEVVLYRLEVQEWIERILRTDPVAVLDVLPYQSMEDFARPGSKRHPHEHVKDVSKYGNELR
ncbi:hypothetical protein [Paenibacillus koleovorans]|uniref:hypothetical protein n=1 Tax=Paenibacillus koleovorans TaxID=121608 RepID=UPI000FD77226|nr:hypothetical protein [Paenibacillus koleovorans]